MENVARKWSRQIFLSSPQPSLNLNGFQLLTEQRRIYWSAQSNYEAENWSADESSSLSEHWKFPLKCFYTIYLLFPRSLRAAKGHRVSDRAKALFSLRSATSASKLIDSEENSLEILIVPAPPQAILARILLAPQREKLGEIKKGEPFTIQANEKRNLVCATSYNFPSSFSSEANTIQSAVLLAACRC